MSLYGLIDRAAQLFQILGLIGLFLGIYVYSKRRLVWALVAAVPCAVGFVLPLYWLSIPAALKSWLVPYTITGIGVSFLLNVGPWVYLLPNALPDVNPKRRGRKRR